MIADVIVMAAGEGTRLRPVTDRWAKPILPVDGRPVIATLLRELAAARLERVWLVTGYMAEQVERLCGEGAFALEIRFVRQPRADGSADAVQRALAAGAPATALVTAADTVYRPGDVERFARAFERSEAAGAIALRTVGTRAHHTRMRLEGRRVRVVRDAGSQDATSAAPLMAFREPVARYVPVACRPPFRPPYELADAFQRAIDEHHAIEAIEVGRTRDLTDPLDLVQENFPYLRGV